MADAPETTPLLTEADRAVRESVWNRIERSMKR
jgi:hypothetical protein